MLCKVSLDQTSRPNFLRTNNLLLCHEQCQLVFPSIGKLAQLDTMHFSTNIRSQVLDLCILEEVWEAWVSVLAMVVVIEDCKR
jgi:hypothetical protein